MADEIVIFDIDGTLADVSERIHHVRKKPKNWNAFFQGMERTEVIDKYTLSRSWISRPGLISSLSMTSTWS